MYIYMLYKQFYSRKKPFSLASVVNNMVEVFTKQNVIILRLKSHRSIVNNW